jgi:DNA-directed RNA polymerase subunit H (RpoH/RPB5)
VGIFENTNWVYIGSYPYTHPPTMQLFVPGEVYANVRTVLGYRGCQVTDALLTPQEIAAQMSANSYVTINATRPQGDPRGAVTTCAVIFNQTASIPNSLPELRTLIEKLTKIASPLEILLITHTPIKPKNMVSPPGCTVFNYPQKIFLIDITKSVNSPKHRLVSEAAIKQWEMMTRSNRANLPKILRTDPQAIYLGLQPGMVCEIDAQNEMTGVATTWRVCVP